MKHLNSLPLAVVLILLSSWLNILSIQAQEPEQKEARDAALSSPDPANGKGAEVVSDQTKTKTEVSVRFLSPTMDAVWGKNSAAVVLEAPIGSRIELQVNGVAVDSNQVGQLETNETTGITRQTWYGVIFKEGDNTLRATATLDGKSASTEIKVQSPGAVAALRLTTIEKRVPADGRSLVTVQGVLLDNKGNPSNRGGRVTLVASSGKFMGVDASPDAAGFQVDAHEGKFTATLQSSLDSGTVQIRADLLELEAFTQVQFETSLRPSLLTGVIDLRIGADNTDYYSSFRDFLNPSSDGSTKINLNGAAFAIGPIGDWLLTAAVNGDRPLNENCSTCTRRLNRIDQASEKLYPTYGDESSLSNLTPSQDQFYFRLEHSPGILGSDPDYVMWGDYATGQEFATSSQEFSALSRQLHGAKVNYNLGNFQVSGLYSQGGQAYQRDTILPDGTTGFYFLTQRLVVPGSEEVYFELEELERPGTVIKRDRLQRVTDYEIDYDRGTIVFNDPVLRTEIGDEGQVLVRRMVISYQSESNTNNQLYAGRLRYHFNREQGQQTWLGTSYFKEDKGDRHLEVYGVDSQISVGENYQLIGEYARSNNTSTEQGSVTGDAYRLDFHGKFSDSITGRAYYRHADTGFANQSTISFIPGQTRYGADLDAKLSNTTQLRFRYDHEDNDGVTIRPIVTLGDLLAAGQEGIPADVVSNKLTTISAGVVQKLGRANMAVDWIYRDRQDSINPTNNGSSSQLRSRFTTPLSKNLQVSLTNETTLSNNTDAVYSDRTQAGLDWRILPGVTLTLNQNWYTRGSLAGQSTTSVNLGGEYRLWKDTVFTGRYSVENFSTGMQDDAALGIKQRWTVLPGLHLDLAYERIFGNLFVGSDGAVGQGAARATGARSGDSLSVRASYTDDPDFKAQVQYEYRNTNDSKTSNVSASLLGKLSPSLTALFDADRRFAAGQATRGLPATTNVRLGLAYRNPYSDRLNALLRYEYRQNPSTIPDTLMTGSGSGVTEHLFAGEAIYSPNWQWEFYSKLGIRRSTLDLAENFSASSTVALAQLRTTYQLNDRIDLTGEVRWIGQPTAGYSEMGWVGEVGFHATPNLRFSMGYSSGRVNNDRDFSGNRSDGGVYFGAMLKLDSLFQGFGLQQPVPMAQTTRNLVAQNPAKVDPSLQASLPNAAPLRLDVSQSIDFQPNSAVLSSEGLGILDSIATVMKQYGEMNLDIQGVLPPLAQLTPDNLDAKRLQAARQHLLGQGIAGDRIIIRAVGQSAPVETAQAQQERPVTFALNAPASTFQLLAAQLGNGTVGSLLGEKLPDLAALPTVNEANLGDRQTLPETTPMAMVENEQPVAALPESGVFSISNPLEPFVSQSETKHLSGDIAQLNFQNVTAPATNTNLNIPSFAFVPEWIIGFASVQDAEPLLIANNLETHTPSNLISAIPQPTNVDSSKPSFTFIPELIIGSAPIRDAAPLFIASRLNTDTTPEPTLDQTVSQGIPANQEIGVFGDRRVGKQSDEKVASNFISLSSFSNGFTDAQSHDIGLALQSEFTFLSASNFTNPADIKFSEKVAFKPDRDNSLISQVPNSLSPRQAHRLEAALSLLLNRDVDTLNALLQTTGGRKTAVVGERIDLDSLMQQKPVSREGTL